MVVQKMMKRVSILSQSSQAFRMGESISAGSQCYNDELSVLDNNNCRDDGLRTDVGLCLLLISSE